MKRVLLAISLFLPPFCVFAQPAQAPAPNPAMTLPEALARLQVSNQNLTNEINAKMTCQATTILFQEQVKQLQDQLAEAKKVTEPKEKKK